jgi:hypothetical protein
MALADAQGDFKALRRVADALISKALTGDVAAIKEVADRLDGRVPQAVVGDDEHPPVGMIITGVPRNGD